MLAEIDPRASARPSPKLVSFGTRHTLSADRPAARHRRRPRLDRRADAGDTPRPPGGRMTVDVPSYVQPPAATASRPPTRISNVLATLTRLRRTRSRVYVVSGHYDSRVTDVMNSTSDAPGPTTTRRAWPSSLELRAAHGHPTARRDAWCSSPSPGRSRASTARRSPRRRYRPTGSTCRACSPTTSSGRAPPTTAPATRTACACSAQGSAEPETADGPGPRGRRRRERLARPGAGPVRARDVAGNEVTGMNIRLIYRLDRYLRGGDHTAVPAAGLPGGPVHRAARELRPPAPGRPGRRTASSTATCCEFCDFELHRAGGRVNAAALWSLAQGPGHAARRHRRHDRADQRHHAVVDARQPRRRVRGGVAADDSSRSGRTRSRSATSRRRRCRLSKDNVVFGVRAVDGRAGTARPRSPSRRPDRYRPDRRRVPTAAAS